MIHTGFMLLNSRYVVGYPYGCKGDGAKGSGCSSITSGVFFPLAVSLDYQPKLQFSSSFPGCVYFTAELVLEWNILVQD